MVLSGGHTRASRPDPAVAAQPLDDLGRPASEADEVGRAAGHELARSAAPRAGRPAWTGRRRARVGDADLEDRVGVRDGDAGQPVLARELGRLLVAAADEPGVVGLDPVDERRPATSSRAVFAERAAEAVERVRDADQAALLAGRGDRLGRATGRAGWPRSRKTQMRSPSLVLTSSPTMTVSPRAPRRARASAPSIRSWSVIARWVSPAVAAARTTSAGVDRQSKRRRRVAVQVDEGPTRRGGVIDAIRSAGRATS